MGRMTRCYTCGYKERILSRVVYCVSCEEAMVHRYCIDRPRYGDEEFDWVCEICCPREYKRPKSRRTNEHLCSKLDSEAEKRKPRRRLIKLGDKSHDHQEDSKKPLGGSLEEFVAELESLPTPEDFYYDQPIGDEEVSVGFTGTRPVEDKENLPGTNRATQKEGSADFDRSRRSSQKSNGTHEGRGRSLKDQDPMKCPPLQEPETDLRCDSDGSPQSENFSSCLPSVSRMRKRSSPLIHKDGDSFLPVPRESRRGTCRVTSKIHGISVELVAHLSNLANFKFSEAVMTLRFPLDLELVDKLSESPKRFSKVPPCGNEIGLYFFPSEASDRKAYDGLLGKMAVNDLILRFTCGDLRLLVFSSLELPKRTQRFGGKLYLWGSFLAPLSLPSSEKVSSCRPLLPSHSKGSSCLEEDLPSNRRSCTPTGREVRSIRKGRGSSDTIRPTQQNAHSNDQRDSGRPSSSPLRPVSLPNRADPQKHDHAASGGKDSACVRKRKHGRDESPDQRRKLDAPGNPANNRKRIFNRPEKENFKQRYNQNSGFFPGGKQKRKNKRKQNQKQWHSPYKKSPLDKTPKPGSRSQRSLKSDLHHEPRTISSGAEHSVGMSGGLSTDQSAQSNPHPHQVPSFTQHEMSANKNWNQHSHPQPCAGMSGGLSTDQSAQSNPHPHQVPSFSQHEMPTNKNWNQHSHPQPCAGMTGGQHPMPATWQAHPQPCSGFPGGQHPVPVTGHPHPMQYAGFPGGQHPMPPGYPGGQHTMPPCYPGGQHTMPPCYPGGQRPLPMGEQSHPQRFAGFPGSQQTMPPGYRGGQHPLPVAEKSHPRQCAGFPGGRHTMPPGYPGGQHTMPPGYPGGQHPMPVTEQSHPQPCAGFPGGQHTMPPGYPGGQHPLPVAGQPHPQQYGGFSGGQYTMPVAGHWHPQPYAGFPGCQHGMPMTGEWHPQPYAGYPSGQQAMWPPHPQAHGNFSGGQQAVPVVRSKGSCS